MKLGFGRQCSGETRMKGNDAITEHVTRWKNEWLAKSGGRIFCGPPRVCWFRNATKFHPIARLDGAEEKPAAKEPTDML